MQIIAPKPTMFLGMKLALASLTFKSLRQLNNGTLLWKVLENE